MDATKTKDSDRGWLIAFVGMIVPSLYAGSQRCFSVFFAPLMSEFGVNYSEVSWLSGVYLAGYGLASTFMPFLYKHISYRSGLVIGGVISCVSVFCASFASSIVCCICLMSLVPGMCTAINTVAVYGAIHNHFDKRKNTAMQILCAGGSIGSFVYCPVYQLLVDCYTWRGALQVISGFYLNIVVVGVLLIPQKNKQTKAKRASLERDASIERIAAEETHTTCSKTGLTDLCHKYGIQVLISLRFHLFTWAWIFFAAAFYSSLTFLIPFGHEEIGLSDVQATILVSAVSLGEIGSRFMFGGILDKFKITQRMVAAAVIFGIMSCLFLLIALLPKLYVVTIILCAFCGLGGGGMDAVFSVLAGEIFGLELFESVYSFSGLISFLCGGLTTILMGAAIDKVGNIKVVFLLGSGSLLLGALSIVVLAKLMQRHSFNNMASS